MFLERSGEIHQGKQKDVLVAYILWFFLGLLGVHRFYPNDVLLGLLYLFTFLTEKIKFHNLNLLNHHLQYEVFLIYLK